MLVDVEVAEGAEVEDAVRLSGVVARHGLDPARLAYALHGKRAAAGARLSDGDRVEILRPLRADPKTLRLQRAEAHPLPRAAPRVKARRRRG